MKAFRVLPLVFVLSTHLLLADSVINFEGLADSTAVTNQFAGMTFLNATAITAGITLNEFEFPPHSGSNVVFDDGGPMSISFATPVLSFVGYFTYAEPLTLIGFGALNNQVAIATSAFSNNEALSGDLNSSPNEFLQLSFAPGISQVTIAGDLFGGSFVLDDVTFATPASPVPEPSSWLLLAAGVAATVLSRALSNKHKQHP